MDWLKGDGFASEVACSSETSVNSYQWRHILRRLSLMEGLFVYLTFSHFPPILKNYGTLLINVLFSFTVFGCFWNRI